MAWGEMQIMPNEYNEEVKRLDGDIPLTPITKRTIP